MRRGIRPLPRHVLIPSVVVALLRRCLVVILAALVFVPVSALAAGQAVINDLNDNGLIDRCHRESDYTEALNALPKDTGVYEDRVAAIQQAQIDHVLRPGEPCPNVTATTAPDEGSSVPGAVIWGIVGAALIAAAVSGAVLARKNRDGDGPSDS